ncbi:MAG: AbrB/MazE/SpoVT family DNA-binding domain-containing protein [Spirochaetia bacterium]|nr:AbrB/MazE/SpoVT family DNA-binding domain-containing protein [Spirochaetia bacterium]
MDSVIQKWGNSLGIRIPNSIAKELNLENGSHVEIVDDDGKIIIFPQEKKNLKQKLEMINLENIHEEISTGPVIGKEEW